MALKEFNPTSPSRRGMIGDAYDDVTGHSPVRALSISLKRNAGRNNQGRISVRHQGGGSKHIYRIIDFKRDKEGVPASVASIEYDPSRSARIALLQYVDGEKRYILAPLGLKVGDKVQAGPDAEIKPGNSLTLRSIPTGTMIHNIEMLPGKGGQIVRSAGAAAQLMAKEEDYVQVRLPSGEVRRVRAECRATIGQVGNTEHENLKLGKAGANRWRGKRPTVRGSAMNPRDHPHGGGEGRSPVGMPGPKTPWGKPAMGYRTRRNKRTDKFIVKSRKKK